MDTTKVKNESSANGSGKSMKNNNIEAEPVVREFLESIKEDTEATLVLNGNGNGSKNLIFNSVVIQTTDNEASDVILDKIKNLPSEKFEDILLAIASQLKQRNEKKNN